MIFHEKNKSLIPLIIFMIMMCLMMSTMNSFLSYSTVGTIIDKEYRKSTFITHQRYQFKVSFIDKVGGKEEESVEWIDVTPTEYENYDIGDKYEDSSRDG